jgi:hypothetical protein
MSVLDDDRTVATLKRLAPSAAPGGWLPDEAAVLRRGRLIRTRRTVAAAGAGALVLALAIGVPAALTSPRTAPPAGPTPASQEPRPAGDTPVARLTDEIQAVSRPVVAADGALVAADVAGWDLRLRKGDSPWWRGGWDGVDVEWESETAYGSAGVTWTIRDGGTDRARFPVPEATPSGDDSLILAGAVPAWVRDPVALLRSGAAFDLGAGGVTTTVELPTFAAPTGDGRLLYAVVLRGDAADRFGSAPWQMAFVGADGEAYVPGCAATTLLACEESLGLPLTAGVDGPVARFGTVGVADTVAQASPTEGTEPGSASAPAPCAEFPPVGPLPGDLEGWWNGTPADADGNVVTDPELWPAEPREHPRVALVDTDTGAPVSTWDRVACGPDPDYAPVPQVDWPAGSVAIVDMDTGETLGFSAKR